MLPILLGSCRWLSASGDAVVVDTTNLSRVVFVNVEADKPLVPPSCCRKDQYGKYYSLQRCQTWTSGPPHIQSSFVKNEALFYKVLIFIYNNTELYLDHLCFCVLLLYFCLLLFYLIILCTICAVYTFV